MMNSMSSEPPRQKLLRPDTVQLLMGVTRWQLNKIVRDGALPCVWLNQRVRRFRLGDVERYMGSLPTERVIVAPSPAPQSEAA